MLKIAMAEKKYSLYVVTYLREEGWQTAKIRATDKRRAKTLARQRYGSDTRIFSAVKWDDYQKGKRR